jgi:hypothetical protein
MTRPVIAETKEWRLWKNRQRQDAIVVSLSAFQGHTVVGVRQFYTNGQGQMRPTAKGVTMSINRLPELAKAIEAALKEALSLGLLHGKGETEAEQ